MSFFKSCSKNISEELNGRLIYRDNFKSETSQNLSHSASLKLGFIADEFHDVYVLKDYGVYCFNLSSTVKAVEKLRRFYDEDLKCNPYHKIINLMNDGYKFVLGPAFPLADGNVSELCVGLYCSNYYEMIEKENQNELKF